MDRRTFLAGALAVIAAPHAAAAQPGTKVPRVGLFLPGSSSGDQFQQLSRAFREGLRDLGWIEGQTIGIEVRWGEGRIDEFPRIASELLALSVDAIVAWGPQSIRAVQQATATVPIVMAIVHEPVAFGFIRMEPVPLDGFTGHRTIRRLGIATDTLADSSLHDFKNRMQDAVVFLDLRAFGVGILWVELGLVEPRKSGALPFDFDVRQLLLVTVTSPWVYVAAGVQQEFRR